MTNPDDEPDICMACLDGEMNDADMGYWVCPECDAEYNQSDLFDPADDAFDPEDDDEDA